MLETKGKSKWVGKEAVTKNKQEGKEEQVKEERGKPDEEKKTNKGKGNNLKKWKRMARAEQNKCNMDIEENSLDKGKRKMEGIIVEEAGKKKRTDDLNYSGVVRGISVEAGCQPRRTP